MGPWASGACGPVLRPVEITKDLKKSQAKDQGSWVKNGLECGLKVQGRGGEGSKETADKPHRPRKALQHPHLLSGLLMADARAGGEATFCDAISRSKEVP